MKKTIAIALVLILALSAWGCSSKSKAMSHEDFVNAALDSEVVVETYVQAHQSWWDNKITCYTQDKTGGYFLYEMPCSEADAAKLVPGTKLRVTGFKSEWSGEVEITDAKFEILKGSYIADPVDVTSKLGTPELDQYSNMLAAFKGMKVEPSTDANGNEAPFLYAWDGSGSRDSNSDLYFYASVNGKTYYFCVESYLKDNTTDVYKAVESLKIGDIIDIEGFLYWYSGEINPHVTSVKVV